MDKDKYLQTNNIRFAKQGRPRGLPNLTEEQKAAIVLDKNLHQISQPSIAKKHGVSRATVIKTTEESLSAEGKQYYASFVEGLTSARDKIVQRINEKLDNDTFKDGVYPNLLTAVNNAHRLETGQSTSNVSVQGYAQILAKWITEHAPEPELITRKIDAICDAQGLTNAQAQELRDAVIVGKC